MEREIRIMDAQPTNLQQLRDGIASKYLRNVSNTLLNFCHKELRQFWRQRGIQPGTSKVYLIKWPVSVGFWVKCNNYWVIHHTVYSLQPVCPPSNTCLRLLETSNAHWRITQYECICMMMLRCTVFHCSMFVTSKYLWVSLKTDTTYRLQT